MPNGSADFSLDYGNIEEVIIKIQQGNEQITGIIDKLSSIVAGLEAVWKGTDANEYVTKMNEYKPNIMKLQNAYLEAANALKNMSTQYQEKQAENVSAAQSELY